MALVVLAMTLLCLAHPAQAALTAEISNSEVNSNQTVELTIRSDLDVTSGINLFDLNTLSIEPPDLSALEADWDILDRRQKYRVQIENNVNKSVIEWKFLLRPNKIGQIKIPPIKYNGESTQPFVIRVTKEVEDPDAIKDVMLKVDVDKSSVYVQEQLILRVRIYYSGDLIKGSLSHPDHPDAMFVQMGKQQESSEFIGRQRYRVTERKYAVFPRVAGSFEIPSISFEGTLLEPPYGRRFGRKLSSDPIPVEVKPPPASFQGSHWLPAQSLNIREVWNDPTREITVGESLTRTLSAQALGLEGSSLPPFPRVNLQGLRNYPEQPAIETENHAAGVTGSREESQAFVAIRPGTYQLPEIRIPWWDVVNDQPREAIIAARTITILPAPGQSDNPSTGSNAGLQPSATGELPPVGTDNAGQSPANQEATGGFWPLLAAIFAILWLSTIGAWWYSRKQNRQHTGTLPRTVPNQYKELKQLAKTNEARFMSRYAQWLKSVGKVQSGNVGDVAERGRVLLHRLEKIHYGSVKESETAEDIEQIKQDMLDLVKSFLHSEKQASRTTLPGLYPDTLNPGN